MNRLIIVALLGCCLGWSGTTMAHHSIAAEYGSSSKELKSLIGKVTKVRWNAPHVEIYVSATEGVGANGEEWIINSHAPGLLARTYGILRGEVSVGDTVSFLGWPSRYDVPRFHMRALQVNDGPMRSTHRPSDSRDLREGTLGNIVPSPGLGAEDTYGSNLGGDGALPPSQTNVETPASTPESGFSPILMVTLLLVAVVVIFGLIFLKRRSHA